MALLKMRLLNDGIDPGENLLPYFKEHLERGVIILFNRIKNFNDIANLLEG